MSKKNAQSTKKPKKPIHKAFRFFLSVGLILAIGYVTLNYVPFIAKYDHYAIATGSMEPIIMTGDVVIIDNSVDVDDLETGQIVAFYADIRDNGTEEVVVHYLYSIEEIDGDNVYRTKPAINDRLDPWELTDDDILGVHVLTVKNIGSFLMFAQSTLGRIILIVDLVVIYLILEIFSSSKKKEKESKELELEESS